MERLCAGVLRASGQRPPLGVLTRSHKAWNAVECGPVQQDMEVQLALGQSHPSSHMCDSHPETKWAQEHPRG